MLIHNKPGRHTCKVPFVVMRHKCQTIMCMLAIYKGLNTASDVDFYTNPLFQKCTIALIKPVVLCNPMILF